MPLKGKEQEAAMQFSRFLQARGEIHSWTEGGDPPDLVYALSIRGEEWGVEVTELHQYFEAPSGADSRASFDRPIRQLCERLRSKIGTGGSIKYVLDIRGPVGRLTPRDIERLVLDQVASEATGTWQLDSQGRVVLTAVSGSPGSFGCRFMFEGATKGPGGRANSANITENVRFAVERILSAKAPRMQRVTEYDRRLLLVWNSYWLVSADSLRWALSQVVVDPFDAIVLTDDSATEIVADPSRLF